MSIQFLLNNQLITLNHFDHQKTLLRYLRDEAKKTGTKEGCAEGDCGACTLLIGYLNKNNKLSFKALNSCIICVGTLHQKWIITVEGLKELFGNYHPVQDSLVVYNGSQCGYCTPGIVMSLFSLYIKTKTPSTEELHQCLAGNLCRCTGYQPIHSSSKSWVDNIIDEKWKHLQQDAIKALKSIDKKNISPTDYFYCPTTLSELSDMLDKQPDATLLSGGTDLLLHVTKHLKQFKSFISLSSIEELRSVSSDKNYFTIGSAAPIEDYYADLTQDYPDLDILFRRYGSVQIRNSATLGGNIANASPIGDGSPCLLALGTKLVLRKKSQTRTIDLDDFFISYQKTALEKGEFIEKILIPRQKNNRHFSVYKISKRFDQDISAVCGAFSIEYENNIITDCKLAFGGMAAIPKRAHKVEEYIKDKMISDNFSDLNSYIKEDFQPLSDSRGTQDYRLILARNLILKFFIELNSKQTIRLDRKVAS